MIESKLEDGAPAPEEPEPTMDLKERLVPVVPKEAKIPSHPTGLNASNSNGASDLVSTPSTAADYVAAGDNMAAVGDWAGASVAYGKAVSIDGGSYSKHYKYGWALFKAGRLPEAQKELLVAANHGQSSAHKILGQILRDQGDISGAMYHFNKYLASDPPDRAIVETWMANLTGG
jgi:tetratricopeptide (TPR) repeat protein